MPILYAARFCLAFITAIESPLKNATLKPPLPAPRRAYCAASAAISSHDVSALIMDERRDFAASAERSFDMGTAFAFYALEFIGISLIGGSLTPHDFAALTFRACFAAT